MISPKHFWGTKIGVGNSKDILKPIAEEGAGITKLVVMVLIFATLCVRRAGMIFGGARPPEVAPLSAAMVSRAAVA